MRTKASASAALRGIGTQKPPGGRLRIVRRRTGEVTRGALRPARRACPRRAREGHSSHQRAISTDRRDRREASLRRRHRSRLAWAAALLRPRGPESAVTARAAIPPDRRVRATNQGFVGLLGPLLLGKLRRRTARGSGGRPLARQATAGAQRANDARAAVAGREAVRGVPDARRGRALGPRDASSAPPPCGRRARPRLVRSRSLALRPSAGPRRARA